MAEERAESGVGAVPVERSASLLRLVPGVPVPRVAVIRRFPHRRFGLHLAAVPLAAQTRPTPGCDCEEWH